MKNAIRKWLGITNLENVVLQQANDQTEKLAYIARNGYEMFHSLPFVAGAMVLTAADAAKLTVPEGITENNLPALLVGIIAAARQGDSSMEVAGELPAPVREALERRGFKVEDHTGSAGKFTFILWT